MTNAIIDKNIIKLNSKIPLNNEGNINRVKIVEKAIKNARSKNNPNNTESLTFVKSNDTGKDILITIDGLKHGLDRRINQNAQPTMQIADIIEVAKFGERLKPRENKNIKKGYTLIGSTIDSKNNLRDIVITIKETPSGYRVEDFVSRLYSVNTKTQKNPTTGSTAQDMSPRSGKNQSSFCDNNIS